MSVPSLTEDTIREKLRTALEANRDTEVFSENRTNQDPKCAAVLIPLTWFEDEWHLLYTRRADRVETHRGQVSFPGGACDPGEQTPEVTALREVQEEIGLHPRDIRLLGRLSPMITITAFRVTPVVGIISWPCTFQIESAEVARVFTIPLTWLADRSNRWQFRIPGRGYSLIVYHPYDGETLWGATAAMTELLIQALGF